MDAYNTRTDAGFEITVFAETNAQAVTLFCIHHEVVMGVMPVDFEVSKIGSMVRPLEQKLEEALASDVIGVGHYLPGRSWKILPADVVMTLEEDHSAWAAIADLKDKAPTRLYRFFGGKKEVFVFARHLAEANSIVTAWMERHAARWRKAAIDPHWGETREGIEAEHLSEALSSANPASELINPMLDGRSGPGTDCVSSEPQRSGEALSEPYYRYSLPRSGNMVSGVKTAIPFQ